MNTYLKKSRFGFSLLAEKQGPAKQFGQIRGDDKTVTTRFFPNLYLPSPYSHPPPPPPLFFFWNAKRLSFQKQNSCQCLTFQSLVIGAVFSFCTAFCTTANEFHKQHVNWLLTWIPPHFDNLSPAFLFFVATACVFDFHLLDGGNNGCLAKRARLSATAVRAPSRHNGVSWLRQKPFLLVHQYPF